MRYLVGEVEMVFQFLETFLSESDPRLCLSKGDWYPLGFLERNAGFIFSFIINYVYIHLWKNTT